MFSFDFLNMITKATLKSFLNPHLGRLESVSINWVFFLEYGSHFPSFFLLVNNSGFCCVEDFCGSLCGFWFSFCFGLLGFYSSSRQVTFLDSTANLSLLCCAAANISVSLFRISIRCFFSLTLYCLPYTCMIWQTKCLGRDSVQIWGHSFWFPYTWRFPLNFQPLCQPQTLFPGTLNQ